MAIEIPELHIPSIAKFAQYSKAEIESFFKAVENTQPTCFIQNFSRHVAEKTGKKKSETRGIIVMLAGLYILIDQKTYEPDGLIADVSDAITKSNDERLKAIASNIDDFKTRLKEALSFNKTLGVIAKARDVSLQHERLYSDGRILTDIRPVFSTGSETDISTMLITQTLQISYTERRDTSDIKDIFITLNVDDLKKLGQLIDRALKKHEAIHALLDDKNIPIIEETP
ncbi:MAG: hypothetical protein V1918_02900 [Planctomycetota bacterium]